MNQLSRPKPYRMAMRKQAHSMQGFEKITRFLQLFSTSSGVAASTAQSVVLDLNLKTELLGDLVKEYAYMAGKIDRAETELDHAAKGYNKEKTIHLQKAIAEMDKECAAIIKRYLDIACQIGRAAETFKRTSHDAATEVRKNVISFG